jgi:hypothetical protein
MDVTDYYKSNLQDTLLFRALTAKGAVRLRNVPGVTAVIQEISKGPEQGISLKSTNGTVITSVPSTFRNKEKQWHLTRNHYHFTKES